MYNRPPYTSAMDGGIYSMNPVNTSYAPRRGRASSHMPAPMLNPNLLLQQQAMMSAQMPPPVYPAYPSVKMKELPYFDVLCELLRPTTLMLNSNQQFVFYLTPAQVAQLSSSDIMVQMRMCLLDTSCEQEDVIPACVGVKINDHAARLPPVAQATAPGMESKRPRRPVDITAETRRTPMEANSIVISGAHQLQKPHVVMVHLVRKLDAATLLRRLQDQGLRNPDLTIAMIREKQQNRDMEIASLGLKVSLLCPLGKTRMQLPCRDLTCNHIQCFDATLFLQMNEKHPKFACPVCSRPIGFRNLAIDGYLYMIARKAPPDCTEIQFDENGYWKPAHLVDKRKRDGSDGDSASTTKKQCVDVVDLDGENQETGTVEELPITIDPSPKRDDSQNDDMLGTEPNSKDPEISASLDLYSLLQESEDGRNSVPFNSGELQKADLCNSDWFNS